MNRFVGEYSKYRGTNIKQNCEVNLMIPTEYYKIVAQYVSMVNFEIDCVEIKAGQRRLFEFMLAGKSNRCVGVKK